MKYVAIILSYLWLFFVFDYLLNINSRVQVELSTAFNRTLKELKLGKSVRCSVRRFADGTGLPHCDFHPILFVLNNGQFTAFEDKEQQAKVEDIPGYLEDHLRKIKLEAEAIVISYPNVFASKGVEEEEGELPA